MPITPIDMLFEPSKFTGLSFSKLTSIEAPGFRDFAYSMVPEITALPPHLRNFPSDR
jgi:hypothetical protein